MNGLVTDRSPAPAYLQRFPADEANAPDNHNKEHDSMFKHTLLALATGGAIAFAALTGTSGAAKADTSVNIGIGVPGLYLAHARDRARCWLPERHLCGPYYGRPYYGRPVYVPPVYGRPVYGWPGYYGGYYAPRPYYYGGYRRW